MNVLFWCRHRLIHSMIERLRGSGVGMGHALALSVRLASFPLHFERTTHRLHAPSCRRWTRGGRVPHRAPICAGASLLFHDRYGMGVAPNVPWRGQSSAAIALFPLAFCMMYPAGRAGSRAPRRRASASTRSHRARSATVRATRSTVSALRTDRLRFERDGVEQPCGALRRHRAVLEHVGRDVLGSGRPTAPFALPVLVRCAPALARRPRLQARPPRWARAAS